MIRAAVRALRSFVVAAVVVCLVLLALAPERLTKIIGWIGGVR